MSIDFRVTVFNPTGATVLALDASGDLAGGLVQYEDTPAGCGAARIRHGLRREEIVNRGYWKGMNLVEISSGDNTLVTATAAVVAGATGKFYLDTTWTLDPAQGEDLQQLYFFDGATLTMRCPVQSIGSDAGGSYAIVGTPLGGGGIPAYSVGTLVGRRRYFGRIVRRSTMKSRMPGGDITLVGLNVALAQVVDDSVVTASANVDVGAAILATMQRNASRWPFFTIAPANFPTTGFTYANTQTAVTADRILFDMLSQITSADRWILRIGHDRTPRLVRAYLSSTNTYTYTVTLQQGVTNFEAVAVQIDDEDTSRLFNVVRVLGDTDPATKQPVTAIVSDSASLALYGLQIDSPPINNIAVKDVPTAGRYGLGQLNANSIASAQNKLIVYTKNDTFIAGSPGGVQNGDIVRGLSCVRVTGFDAIGYSTNDVPDSEIRYATTVDALWTGGSGMSVLVAGGPNASDALTATSPSASLNSASTIVVPGQVRSFDGYLDASGITAGTIQWQVINEQTGGVLAAASLSPGSPGQRVPSPSFTIPAGCSSIHVTASMNGATGTGKFAQPNCNNLNRVLPYAPNYATPTVYGLATSIVTTIDLDKYDTWQDCSFIAIEPDWNATVLESANAVLTALQTAATVPSIDSYTVSTEAQGFTTSGLTVTVPAFAAIFARGTAIVTVGGNSFTLIANAINRAWLNPNNTWTVVTDTSTVTGAIFFARFQTNATSVIGSQFVASVGVIKVGVGNVNVAANLPVPTFTTPTVVAGKSPNGTASDVDVTIPLTNVPPEAFALQFYHRISNPGAPRSWIPDDSVQLSGVPNPPVAQTVGFSFALMEHNGIYDFACGYESLGGYGPLTIIASAFAAPGVTIPTTYLSNNGSALALTTSGTSAVNAPSANGITAAVQLAVTVTNQPTDGSTSRYNLWRRPTSLANDATAGSRQPGNAACLFQPVGGGPAVGYGSIPGPTSGTYNDTDSNVTGGQTFDYGISLENTAGGESLIATIALNFATVVVLIPAGSIPPIASLPTANNVNVVPDSGFKFGYFRSGSNFSGGYWTRSGGPSFAWSSTIPLQDPAANNAFQIDAAHTGTSDFIYSKPLTLANGEPYTLSCQFFGDHASGTMPFMALAIGVSTTGVSSYVPGASIGALAGQNGRRSATFTAPGAIGSGTTVCNVVFAANGVTIASGFYFYVQTPMCEPGTVMGAYKQNELDAGTGYIDHLAHSPGVQSTVAVGGGIDFGYANHINKTQDNIQDGTIYQRNYAAQNLPNLVPNGNFQAPGDSAFSEVAGGWQDFGGNSQFSIGRETLAATPGGSDLLIRLLQNQSIPANTQVYRAVTTRKQILLSIGSQPYFLRAYIRSDYSVGLPAGVTATLTVAVRVTYTDGTTFDFGTPGVGQGVNGIVTKVFATDPTKIPSYAIVFCEAIVNNPTASAFATGSTIYLDARFNSITLTHAPTYSDGIDVNNLRPQEAGANVTENRTSNDVSVGNGRAVAQHGADVTGSNTALNTSAVGTTPAAALQAAVDASAIITGTGTSRFATGSTPNTGYTNNLVYVISIPLPSYGTWNLALNWFTTASPQLVNANLVIDASIAAVSGGQVNFFYAQISVNAPNGGVSYQNLSLGAECSAPGQGQTVSFNLLCSSAQGLIALRPGYWAITATRTS